MIGETKPPKPAGFGFPAGTNRSWSFLPIPALMILMVILYFTLAPTVFYDPPWLILIGNTVFVGVIGFLVAGIAWRDYLSTGRLQMLLLGCGVLLFAIGGVLAAIVRGLPGGANLNVTIYNCGALLGAIFHFIAALILLAGLAPEAGAGRRNLWLGLGYGGSVLFMAVLTAASLKGVIPPFFIQGVGPTLLRQQVLGTADLLFVFSCLVFLGTYYRNREMFLYWYAGGLGLTAISLTGFFIQHSVGSPVGWVGRFSQYLGGVYFLVALLTAARSAESRGTSLDDVLATSLTGAEEKFRSAFANAAIGFAMATPAGRFVDANAAYCAILGYSVEELRAMSFPQLVHPDDLAVDMQQIKRMLAGAIADFTVENRYLRKSGQPVWVRKSVSLVRDARGAPRSIVALIEDITARKQAEEALRASEERFRVAQELSPDGFSILRPVRDAAGRVIDFTWVYLNATTARVTGSAPQALVGRTLLTSFPGHRGSPLLQTYQEVAESGEARVCEALYGGDGILSGRWFRVAVVSMGDDIAVLSQDITERKQAEQVVTRSQKTFSELVERAPFGIYIVDSQFRIAEMNVGSQNGAFRNVRPVIGRDFAEAMRILWPEPVAAEIIAHFRHTLETGEPYYSPCFTNPRHDVGAVESYEWELHRMTLSDGYHGVICYYFDSTRLREAQDAVRASEERYRALVTASSDVVYRMSPDWSEMRYLHGREFIADTLEPSRTWLQEYIHPDDQAHVMAVIQEAIRTKTIFELEHRVLRLDGSLGWTFSRAIPLLDANGEIVEWFGTASDVTEHKQAEERLRESQQQNELLARLIRASSQPLAIGYPDGRLGLVNRAFEELTGYTAEELQSLDWATALTPPEWRDVEGEKLSELHRTGHPVRYEKEYIRKDGTRVPIELLVHLVSEGQPLHYYSFITDITERKRTQELLIRSEKVAALGRMAAGLAHDINNPLAAVMNSLFLARCNPECADCAHSLRQYLDLADQELKRVAHITQQALGFYREGSTPTKVAIRTILDETVDIFRSKIKSKNARVVKQYEGEVVEVVGITGEVRQMLSNLFANSLDAIGKDGTIKLRVTSSPDMRVRITIADDGKGIAPGDIPRIFEPLFTTKGSLGTGLGLWVTKQLIDKHGGSIRVRSTVKGRHRGTTFTVVLPSAAAARFQTSQALTSNSDEIKTPELIK